MHRLLVPYSALAEERPALPKEEQRHLKVLRPEEGETLRLFDGAGHIRSYAVRGGILVAEGPLETLPPLPFSITLFACVTKGSRWDWTIEKAVELGVSRIVPVLSDRTIVRLAPAERPAKRERWARIAEDAARQCGALFVPTVELPVDFPAALEEAAKVLTFVGAIMPDRPPRSLLEACRAADPEKLKTAAVFIGPEGDFTPEELNALVARCEPTSFGPTILRAETAALYALSILAAANHLRFTI